MLELLFWGLFAVIIYTYLGYTVVLFILAKVIVFFRKKKILLQPYQPTVTVFIAAYNEKDIIHEKVINLRQLEYDKSKIAFLWITDGSNDGTPDILRQYPDMNVLHEDKRNGKAAAINRGMQYVGSEIVIFCDANNMLSPETIQAVVKSFADYNTGCVAGEKRIIKNNLDAASSSGEGFYWYYESYIKKLESEVNSTVGAAGELCAIRTKLFEPIEIDSLLDDFVISLRIAEKGYKIKYNPLALATETGSASISDEMKRKIRIAAGSFQTIPRLARLLNPFKYGFFTFQYWSHKILRWTVIPYAIILMLPLNICLYLSNPQPVYKIFLTLQLIFYTFVLTGYALRKKKIQVKLLFVPYYIIVMNYCIILGFFKHIKGKQTVNWEKAQRN
jgi:cellulose synthase/poly-beta-1,6-N-acetylglucosamine synthase-like glycosyltransferase